MIPGYTREGMPRGILTDSATENKPPGTCSHGFGKGEKVG